MTPLNPGDDEWKSWFRFVDTNLTANRQFYPQRPRTSGFPSSPRFCCSLSFLWIKLIFVFSPYMPKVKPSADADQTPHQPSDQPLPATYEAALEELETLVQQLESGQLPLDQLLSHYQRGSALLAFCRDRLQAVDQQIQVLDGSTLKPWNGA